MRKTTFLFILSFVSIYLGGAIGCIDNSFHLKDFPNKPDYKTYHYVACNYPCVEYILIEDRGKCLRCGHFHNPKDFINTTTNVRVDQDPPAVKNIYDLFDTKKMIECGF